MDADDIRSAVLATIRSIAPDADVHAIRPERPLRDQVELDSLDWLNVIAGLQERLAVDIPAADHARLATLQAVVDYVASRRAAHAGPTPRPGAAAATSALPCTRHLVDGTAVTLRPMRADDMALHAEFVRHLSAQARYKRFMGTLVELPPGKLQNLTQVDQQRHVALVATVERDGREAAVAVARYVVDAAGTGCEFAVSVDDAWQRSGVAGILMQALIDVARARGLRTMEGLVLRSNTPMLRFARQLGFEPQRDAQDPGTVRVVRAL